MGIFKWIYDAVKEELDYRKELPSKQKQNYEKTEKKEAIPLGAAERLVGKNHGPILSTRIEEYTIYFAYGHVWKIWPEPPGKYGDYRDIINEATNIVSDGAEYDLTDINSIYSIATPRYDLYAPRTDGNELGVTGCLEYVLRMHANRCWCRDEFELSIACLEKATELMLYSSVGWRQKDFYRIVQWLNDLGELKRAKEWEAWIIQNTEDLEEFHDSAMQKNIDLCKKLNTDLVEAGYAKACCGICAKYRMRVFSLTGKDRRFPKFPKDFHSGCGLGLYPFIYGVSRSPWYDGDMVVYSNRLFVDDRTKEEIALYEELLQKRDGEQRRMKSVNINRIIYYKLKRLLPEDTPKSLGAFTRGRNSNSAKYQALVKKAEAIGFVFPETLEDIKKWEDD